MSELWDERFTPADAEIIKKWARRMIGHYGYKAGDVEDNQQELALHVFPRTCRHRPNKGSRERYVNAMAKNKLLNMIEYRTAQKRNRKNDVPLEDVGAGALLDGVNGRARLDLQSDTRDVLASLPDEVRAIATLLMNDHCVAEIERITGLTRGVVRSRMDQIWRALDLAGFKPEESRRPATNRREVPVVNKWRPNAPTGGPAMRQTYVKYTFNTSVEMEDVEGTLHLARLAAETLLGEDRIKLEAKYSVDPDSRAVMIDTTGRVGRTLALIFSGFARREFQTPVLATHLVGDMRQPVTAGSGA